jgi:hypothetical protein
MMKIFGRPEYLNEYRKHYEPLLAGIDTDKAFPTLEIYLLSPEEMPDGGPNSKRPHFTPPRSMYFPVVDVVLPKLYFDSQLFFFFHEIGHYIHTTFLPNEKPEDLKWREWARLSGNELDFAWQTKDLGKARHPYPFVPSFEDFADDFSWWVQGRRAHMEQFYMSLWGQEAKATTENIVIFRKMIKELGKAGQGRLRELIEKDNPRALLYL